MENIEYNAYVVLEVMRVEGETNFGVDHIGQSDGSPPDFRMLATRVSAAYCECKAGADSQCHHIAMVLQLGRLLQMSLSEPREHQPVTATGRACQWILDHCKGGRAAGTNEWWGRTLPELFVEYSKMRDPKKKGVGCVSDGVEQTAGVVQIDRLRAYSPTRV